MEEPSLDPNKIVAEFMQANLDKVLSVATNGVKSVRNAVRANLSDTYAAYVSRLLHRHSMAKSFFVRSEPIPLYDFFVPLDLRTPRRLVPSPGAADVARVARRALLTGSGGSGKSMIMRHLLVSAIRDRSKTPIFLELRQVDLAKTSLESALLGSLRNNGLQVDADYLERAMAAGHFVLLLDGMDELDRKDRERLAAAAQALAETYPDLWIVVSSRPDPSLEGWAGFTHFRVEPLDLDKAVALVQRLRFDPDIKERFLSELRTHLFQTHRSFLSNPLLLSIMLLTYQDTARIPGKLSIFYNQAYESLFQKHDALKGGYQRARRTQLDIQDFARVFAAFCVRTYDKRQFTFSVTAALDSLERCKTVTRLEYNSRAFLDDAYQAVCLLVEEGVDLAFAHRSFQEYFAARFIASASPHTKKQLVKRFATTRWADEVIPLLYEIDALAVEQHYLLPAIESLSKHIGVKRQLGVTHHLKYLRLLYTDFRISGADQRGLASTISEGSLWHALRFAHLHYAKQPDLTDKNALEAASRSLTNVFISTFGENAVVSTKDLTTTNPFVKALANSAPRLWSKRHLSELLGLEEVIRDRVAEADSSVEAILA